MASIQVGPDNGTLTVRTDVTGSAARLGHRLTLLIKEWSAQVEVVDGVPTDVRLEAAVGSLSVESGSGGVTPLSPLDKQQIKRNALKSMHAGDHPQITFHSTGVEQRGRELGIIGDLTIAGRTNAISTTLLVSQMDGSVAVNGTVPLLQTDWGIKPYGLVLGQLKVADEVAVDIEATVSAP